jgi:uncharacterized protein YjbI with pentapeptide repeats
MANEQHLAKLREGAEAWNEWCKASPNVWPDLSGADLRGMDLRGTDLRTTDLINTKLSGANLGDTVLNRANLGGADLNHANLSGASLNHAELKGASLSGADLSGANLLGAELDNADLHGADLRGAKLGAAHLCNVSLGRANLSNANLTLVDLRSADLRSADLDYTDLRSADLGGAAFHEARFNEVSLANVDLRGVKGLDTVKHEGPSTIGIDTIYKSHGQIPEAFLRGCGVPEEFIKYIPALIGAMQPIEFYSAFISYSGKDEEFAKRLHDRLRGDRVRVWFAPEDLKIGEMFESAIDKAIRSYDKLMVVLSGNSIESAWVEREVRKALRQEAERGQPVLFPIRLDAEVKDTTQQWAYDLRRQRHIGDFTQWKEHDAFETAYKRLLRDLQATAPPKP